MPGMPTARDRPRPGGHVPARRLVDECPWRIAAPRRHERGMLEDTQDRQAVRTGPAVRRRSPPGGRGRRRPPPEPGLAGTDPVYRRDRRDVQAHHLRRRTIWCAQVGKQGLDADPHQPRVEASRHQLLEHEVGEGKSGHVCGRIDPLDMQAAHPRNRLAGGMKPSKKSCRPTTGAPLTVPSSDQSVCGASSLAIDRAPPCGRPLTGAGRPPPPFTFGTPTWWTPASSSAC